MIRIDDEVITKVSKGPIPSGTWGVVTDMDEEGIWVDDYYYDYQDTPPISANSMERMNSLLGGTRNPTVEELIQNGDSK